jgi:hypothetical protein
MLGFNAEEAQMPDQLPAKMQSIPTWIAIAVFCLSCATGSWALATELHNYRLVNITTRLKSHEDAITSLRADNAGRDVVIEHINTELGGVTKTLKEVRDDIKSLLTAP